MKEQQRGVCVGAGYFSQFHFDAWSRMRDVRIAAVCDVDVDRARAAADRLGAEDATDNLEQAIADHRPDFVDIITPPQSHLELVRIAAQQRIPIICQKPLAPTLHEARTLVQTAADYGAPLMVHENFRFQPWHREIHRLVQQGAIGDQLHALTFHSRMGDGWGPDAYLGRQPYFRTMPRLLIFETGIHFIDTFRYLAGPISGVYAMLRQLNPVIAGEDAGIVLFEFASGAVGTWDANRYNESNHPNPRYTFGEFLVEGNGGSIRLDQNGRMTVQPLGKTESEHQYARSDHGFGGDCVFATQRHFIDQLRAGADFETNGRDYLSNLEIQEAIYESAKSRMPVRGL